MSRKRLTNNEKFVFNETEFVNPLGKRALSDRSSAQRRLFAKAEMNKPSFNSPIPNPVSPPYTPIRSTRVSVIGPGGDNSSNKNVPTTDPCVEEVVAKLALLNTQPTNLPTNSQQKNSYKSTKPFSQVIFDPFEAYHKRSDTSEQNNSILNHYKFKEQSTTNQKGSLIGNKRPTLTWKPPVMFKPAAPLSPPLSPGDDSKKGEADIENELLQDQNSSCICLRPLKLILCPVCANTTTGRIRKTCQVHPKALYLLDIEACPRCKENKFILKEYDLPEGFKQVNNCTN